MNIKIGNKIISKNSKCLVIAEMSGNHAGSLSRLKKLIIKAKNSGADLIKLQTYTADGITINSKKNDFKINKKTPWKKNKNLWDLYKNAQTPYSWLKDIFLFCKKNKITVFSSPFDEYAVDFLEKLKCPAYKIASPEINHIPLIERIAKTKKPVILSIGLAETPEIKTAINILKKKGSSKIIILQCVSAYPAPSKEQNLKLIPKIQKKFKVYSGLSDHSLDNTSAIAAVTLGAKVIEKHFNLSDNKETVDSFFSANEKNFFNLVKSIRDTEAALGNGNFGISKSSKKNLNSRRSIYISKDVKKDEIISKKNIKVVRPSFGLHPKYFKRVLGKKFKKSLNKGDRLMLNHIT